MKQFGTFALDTSNECIWQGCTQLFLPPKPFAVLRYLVEHPGRLVTHDELLDALWPDTYVQPQILRTYMLDLRKLLGDDAGQPTFIQTLPKRGYCFLAPVKDVLESEPRSSERESAREGSSGEAVAMEVVGRDRELALLMSQLDSVAGHQRRIVFVTGEAGIGKTALIEAFCQQAGAARPLMIGRGHCVEGFAAKEQYYPMMEALGQICSSSDGERACRVLSRMSPVWLAALGRSVDNPATSADRPAALERMAGDVCGALEELALEKPLILIFEDLNWADDSTLNLISALARRRTPAKLMVLASCRPQDLAKDHPLRSLKQDLQMRRFCVEVALEPLAKTAIRTLLSRELKQEELPSGLTSFVHQHSEGNPLFAIAILEHLIAQRFLTCDGTDEKKRWQQRARFEEIDADVPAGLAQMIELEMDRLGPNERRVLEAGSLVSIAFPAWAVAAALEQDVAEIEEICEAMSRRLHFLERAGEDELPDGSRSAFFVFAHGLYREVLYQRQSPSRRAKMHVRIAERLTELFSGRETDVIREVSYHYEAAGQWERAVKALCVSAYQAQCRRAHAEAADLLERALKMAGNLKGSSSSEVVSEITDALATAHHNLKISVASE